MKKKVARPSPGQRLDVLEKDVYIIKSLLMEKLDRQSEGLRNVIESLTHLSRAVARIEERLSHVETRAELVVVKEGA